MLSLKQMLLLFFLLQLLGLSTCQAKSIAEQKRSYLRRLLKENIMPEDKVQEILQAEGLEPLEETSVDNSTVVIFDWESMDHLTDGFEEETGRRNLVASCPGNQYADYTRKLRFNAVRVNGKCMNGMKNPRFGEKFLAVHGDHVQMDVSVTNKRDYCPGCIEQLYFGLFNDNQNEDVELMGDCVNLGSSYNTRTASRTFHLKRSHYWVYAFAEWQYHCYQSPKKHGIFEHIIYHDNRIRGHKDAGLIYGLIYKV